MLWCIIDAHQQSKASGGAKNRIENEKKSYFSDHTAIFPIRVCVGIGKRHTFCTYC